MIVTTLMAMLIAVVVQLFIGMSNCPFCGHLNAEHYRWLVVPSRCRMCHRWCRNWTQ